VTSAIRQRNFPNFDDIDTRQLEGYLAKHGRRLRERLGGEEYLRLMDSAVTYAEYVKRWHSREPRVVGRILGIAFGPVYFVSDIGRRIKRLMASGQLRSEVFIRRGIVRWLDEGKLTQEEAHALRQALREPEVAVAMNNLGIQMALALVLFFPFGSLERFFWTIFHRLRAEVKGIITRKAPHAERELHTLLVAVIGLTPKLGGGAYLFSKPLRSNRGLAAVGVDRLLRKFPFKLYRRLKLQRVGARIIASGKPRAASV